MRRNAGAAVGALLVCIFMSGTARVVLAQTSSPPSPPADADCAVIIGGSGVNDGRMVFPQGDSFSVEGVAGCAAANDTVRVGADGDPSTFANGTFRARADGSYRSHLLVLPTHLALGPHQIVVVVQGGREYVSPILIFESEVNASVPSDDAGRVDEGDSTTETVVGSSADGDGRILRLVLWALVVLTAGTALVLAAIRGGWRWPPIGRTGIRLGRRRPTGPLALPAPDIPHIDTRGFVPLRPRETESPRPEAPPEAEGVTEADLLETFWAAR